MPCDSVRTIGTNLGKVDLTRMATVLTDAGWAVRSYQGGLEASRRGQRFVLTEGQERASYTGMAPDFGTIKRDYAARTVTDAVKRFGGLVVNKTDTNNTIQMRIRMRG